MALDPATRELLQSGLLELQRDYALHAQEAAIRTDDLAECRRALAGKASAIERVRADLDADDVEQLLTPDPDGEG